MARLRFATVWLGGCSGCHMSFLDLDEWLIDLSEKVQLVYSPVMDVKEFPKAVRFLNAPGSPVGFLTDEEVKAHAAAEAAETAEERTAADAPESEEQRAEEAADAADAAAAGASGTGEDAGPSTG